MSLIDVNTFVGGYPFRHVPHPDPEILIRVMDREGIAKAWVGHLPSAFFRDPTPGNAELYKALAPFAARLRPAPAIRPDWPGWERSLQAAVRAGSAAVRLYPPHWSLAPASGDLAALACEAGDAGLPVLLTVRFEDLRQRHAHDVAGDLQPAAVRALARAGESVRIVVTAAGRDFIEEVHWGLTPAEQERVFYDISWIWGPPEDHLAILFSTIGAHRFVFGTGWPLRLTQNPRAILDLLPDELLGAQLAAADAISGSA